MDEITKLHSSQNSRWWCFTINNYTDDDIKQLNSLESDCIYVIYGFEVSKTGTPHLQGYLELSKPQRFSWVKKRISRAYIAKRKGSRTQARDYCAKECSKPYEYGKWIPDRQGMRNDLTSMKRKIDEGYNQLELYDEHFGNMVRYGRGIREYMLLKNKKRKRGPVEVHWTYGASGSGKSRYWREKYPDAYIKGNTKWWDGYDGEPVVIWDDYSPCVPYQTLLQWTDRYRCSGETKGGTVPLVFNTIIFTSTKEPDMDEQFRRRCGGGVNITPVTSLQIIGTEEEIETINRNND